MRLEKPIHFCDLVDRDELRELCESFTSLTGAATAILDLEGTVLSATGWKDICTRFHRVHPETTSRCRESDTVLSKRLGRGERHTVYRCRNGLIDVAVPIVIGGEHVANFFTGQFLFDAPDRAFFIRQAEEFGFDRDAYLDALDGVPVFSEEQVRTMMEFLTRLSRVIGETGLVRKQIEETNSRLGDANRQLRREMSEREQAERAILAANERFRSILAAAKAYAIIGTDLDGVITVFSEGAEMMLGYSSGEIIGRPLVEALHEPDEIVSRAAELGCPPGFALFASSAFQSKAEPGEWTYIRKNGERISVSLTVSVTRNEEDEPSGFMSVARDITAEKKMEQQMLQSQKLENIGLLAGGVAHDFNNLLTPILGFSEMLLPGFSEADPRRERLLQIRQAAERAKELTRQLLAFSRRQLMELKLVCLGEIILRFDKMLRRMIREDIRIELRVSPSLSPVRADAGQIEQVLANLSVNAQDAMPEGGLLVIEAKDVELDPSQTSFHPGLSPGPHVLLMVSDTGSGMDGAVMEHVFEPFFTTKAPGKGTGLGLSTVYGIVRKHGGSISVYSEKERGTVFKILLPTASLDGAITGKPCSSETALFQGTETVVVVEDNEMVRTLVCDMLRGFGYRVHAAESPDRCLELQKRINEPVDLLLTDVVMPGMNGKELYGQLHDVWPDMKVLFMSGYTSNVIGHHGVLDEGIQFIQKPFSVRDLAEKVRHALDSEQKERVINNGRRTDEILLRQFRCFYQV